MEFPDLGQQCAHSSCKQLDFLPVKCDACSGVFCKDHYLYDRHQCKDAYLKNNQVPICPLCNKPVPAKKGQMPDIAVGDHIDKDCQSDSALKKSSGIYSNRCSVKGCKGKELMPLICTKCKFNYCLKHRHAVDHNCGEIKITNVSKAGSAALKRIKQQQENNSSLQSRIAEDEALARALQQSMNDEHKLTTGNRGKALQTSNQLVEDEERDLAEAIERSKLDYHKTKDKCLIC